MTGLVEKVAYRLLESKPTKGQFSSKARPKMGQKTRFFKNEPEKLLILNRNGLKTNRNEPKNKAEKLLKTGECIKNEPKTNRAMLLKIQEGKIRGTAN